MVNIRKSLLKKAEELRKQSEQLPKITIDWESPINICCADLSNENKAKSLINKIAMNNIPAIYYFEITNHINPKIIVEALKDFKVKKGRSCPKINKELMTSKFLYCGSVEGKQNLYGRFIQHLGFGSKNTYALQLKYWAKHLNLELRFHYAFLNNDEVQLTKLIEFSLADTVNPLVGKRT